MKKNDEIKKAWRTILMTLRNLGYDFLMQDEIDTVVEALKKAMEGNNE